MKTYTSLEEQIRARLRARRETPEYFVGKLKVDFAEAVSRQLEKTNISRAELAKRLGTSRAYVTKMLNEVLLAGPNLTMESMVKLAFALGAQIEPRLVPLSHVLTESRSSSGRSSPADSKSSKRLGKHQGKENKDYVIKSKRAGVR